MIFTPQTVVTENPANRAGRMTRAPMGRAAQIRDSKTIYAFRLEDKDVTQYNSRLYGFSHGTNITSLRNILQGGNIMSSYNLRLQRRSMGLHDIGGDKGHDGQHAVYFRFVEKRGGSDLPNRILKSLHSVGSSSGVVLFLPLKQALNYSFSLAGANDGLYGINCFKSDSVMDAQTKFEAGIRAAQTKQRQNEIGFYGNISLQHIDLLAIKKSRLNNPDYHELFILDTWHFYARRGSPCEDLELPAKAQAPSSSSTTPARRNTAKVMGS